MSLTQEQITRLAKLTSLHADSGVEISTVLDSVEAVTSTDTDGVSVISRSGNSSMSLRPDEVKEDNNIPNQLLNCSPQKTLAHQIVLAGIMQGE